jgi:hypothetical protein
MAPMSNDLSEGVTPLNRANISISAWISLGCLRNFIYTEFEISTISVTRSNVWKPHVQSMPLWRLRIFERDKNDRPIEIWEHLTMMIRHILINWAWKPELKRLLPLTLRISNKKRLSYSRIYQEGMRCSSSILEEDSIGICEAETDPALQLAFWCHFERYTKKENAWWCPRHISRSKSDSSSWLIAILF